MIQSKFLILPLFYLFFLFTLDKLFLFLNPQQNFLQPGHSVFYFRKKQLINEIVENFKSRQASTPKLALVFGDSRSYPFSNFAFSEKSKQNWMIYNFSAPQAVPMYSYEKLEEILSLKIKPDLVVWSLSPESFGKKKGFVISPFFRYGSKDKWQYWEELTWTERWESLIDELFQIRKFEINPSILLRRISRGKLSEYLPEHNPDLQLHQNFKGEFLMYATLANPTEKLEKDAARISQLYLNHLELGNTQIKYVAKGLELASQNKIPVVLVFPTVYSTYRKGYEKFRIDEVWWKGMEDLAKKWGAFSFDVEKESDCKVFNDASHQSVFCFPPQMEKIWEKAGFKGETFTKYPTM